MVKISNMADSWTSSSTTYNAIKMDVADTASSSTSRLLNLLVNGSSVFRVIKDGNVYLSGVYINGGQLLDTYEEGTFTPVIADAASGGNVGTGSTTVGRYTKIGRVVAFTAYVTNIDTTGMTSGNSIFITGFPYTFKKTSSLTVELTRVNRGSLGYTFVVSRGIIGTTYAKLKRGYVDGTGTADITIGELDSGTSDLYLNGIYET